MERVLFEVGPFTVYTFGASIAVGILAALWLADWEAKRVGLDADKISTLSLILLVAGILGARLFFVMFYNPAYYLQNPWDIFKIYEGGLSIHGGILGGILAGIWYSRRANISFWAVADILAPAVLLAQGIARVGCDVYGKVMTQVWPWGVQYQGQLVHPVQIYETILDLVLLIFLWGKKERKQYSGQIFVYYLGGYALIRMVLEFFRTNPVLIGNLTPAHLTSALFIIAALIVDRWCSCQSALKSERTYTAGWNNKIFSTAMIVLAIACIKIFYGLNGI